MDYCTFPDCFRPAFVKETAKGSLCNGHYAQFRRGKELTPLRGYKHQEGDSTHDQCPYADCGRPSWHKHGYCQTHQRQLWEADGEVTALQPIRNHQKQVGNECDEEGCDRPAKSKGYCSKHYRQDWGTCTLPDCERKMHNKKSGLCARHYSKLRKIQTQPDAVEVEEVHAQI